MVCEVLPFTQHATEELQLVIQAREAVGVKRAEPSEVLLGLTVASEVSRVDEHHRGTVPCRTESL